MKIGTWMLRQGKDIILVYHSLAGEKHATQGYVSPRQRISVRLFENQLKWLSQFADFVGIDELIRTRGDGQWRVAVTFDDGYRDNIEVGLPLFRRYQVPVTWFVCPRFVENRERLPWWDLVDYALYEVRGEIDINLENTSRVYNLGETEQRKTFRSDTRNVFMEGGKDEREALYASLYAACERRTSIPENGFADPGLVSQAASSPWIQVGGHTKSHVNLASVSLNTARNEISAGRKMLEEWTNETSAWFAYPYGRTHHYDEEVCQVIRECNFEGAVTTTRGYVGKRADPFELPRFVVPVWAGMTGFRAGVLALNQVDGLVKAAGSSLGWLRSLLIRRTS